jgi:hypothetical protein
MVTGHWQWLGGDSDRALMMTVAGTGGVNSDGD